MRVVLLGFVTLLVSSTAFAQAPNTSAAFRDGANHHLGDAAFVAEYGRPPDEHEEKLRIHTHFLAVMDLLKSRPATRPELAAQREAILSHFAAYIAKGTTPQNAHLPWRTPVFIDDAGTICAVGYLIEQTAGRSLSESIAKQHRYAYLEEIAAAMPEVQRWVEHSGLTLEELASIQPGYEGPDVAHVQGWAIEDVPDGAYAKDHTTGTIVKHHMEGAWTVTTDEGLRIGSGTFHRGTATWKSTYRDGAPLAEGSYARDQPDGAWKIFHPSGNLAAEGSLSHGSRNGRWRFYYDTPAKTPLATGRFDHGFTTGTWHHFDAAGALLAVSTASSASGQFLLDIVPGKDGIGHQIDQQGFTGDPLRLDMVSDGKTHEHLYVQQGVDAIYDQRGNRLVHSATGWTATACGWSAARKRAARDGDTSGLHELIKQDRFDDTACTGAATAVPAPRAHTIDTMLASVRAVRAQTPEFMREVALGEATVDDAQEPTATGDVLGQGQVDDLSKVLAAGMAWFIEWPHIDGKFTELDRTLAGLIDTSPH